MKNLFSKGSQCLGDESSLNVDMEENHTVNVDRENKPAPNVDPCHKNITSKTYFLIFYRKIENGIQINQLYNKCISGVLWQTFTSSKSTIETLGKRCEICSKFTIKTPKRCH